LAAIKAAVTEAVTEPVTAVVIRAETLNWPTLQANAP
jgi:hypothetical protein